MGSNIKLVDLLDDPNFDSKKDVIQKLMNGNKEALNSLGDKRNDKNFMLPLMYAIKNEPAYNSYIVFLHCGSSLQKSPEVYRDVLAAEPQLIAKTDLRLDKDFIIDNIASFPQLADVMDSSLRTDTVFIKEIEMKTGVQIVDEIKSEKFMNMLETDENLKEDKNFIAEAISANVELLGNASEEIKNDYDFMRKQSKENESVVDYVAENKNDFGLDGIKAVEQTSRDITMRDSMTVIEDAIEKSEDHRFAKVRDTIAERGTEDPIAIKAATAMVTKLDTVSSAMVRKTINYSTLVMEEMKRDVDKDGNMNLKIDNAQRLITPRIIATMIDKAQDMDEDTKASMQQKLDEYTVFYEEYQAKFREYKREHRAELLAERGIEDPKANANVQVKRDDVKGILTGVSGVQVSLIENEVCGAAKGPPEEPPKEQDEIGER